MGVSGGIFRVSEGVCTFFMGEWGGWRYIWLCGGR